MGNERRTEEQREEHIERIREMRAEGYSIREIAVRLELPKSTISYDVQEIKRRYAAASGREIVAEREERLEELEQLRREAWEHYRTAKTRPGQSGVALDWAKEIRALSKEMRSLLGLDAPSKIAPTDPTGEREFSGVTLDEALVIANQAIAKRDAKDVPDSRAD